MNGAKTVDMVIHARREDNIPSPPSPVISGHAIRTVSTFKLLGVQISSDLSWDAHIKYMISKVCHRIYYLCAAKQVGLPCDVLMQVYLTFIWPVLEYASPVWTGMWSARDKKRKSDQAPSPAPALILHTYIYIYIYCIYISTLKYIYILYCKYTNYCPVKN